MAELRRRREAIGLSGPQVARELNWSTSKISRLENGQTLPRSTDVEALLTLYQIPEPERTRLLDLVPPSTASEWWEQYADAIPPGFIDYLGYESGAEESWEWQAIIVPGLLQTPDYARMIIDVPPYKDLLTPRQIRSRIELRMARIERVLGNSSASFNVVLDESTLMRRVGDNSIMAAQIRHLMDVAETPNLSLQVLLNREGLPGGYMPNFILLKFPTVEGFGEIHPEVLYVEDESGGNVDMDEMRTHRQFMAFKRLSEVALNPQDTIRFLESQIEKWV
ncbi:helix-turn-helix transcriptional regulator [Nonomuraea sp. NPDC003709]|uniref:helix-turn-helix domain-containing protein n=1 Tax=Nonomuraea sp. NPDC003709 TaxID=3154450 RepID=UPI0033A9EC60